MSQLTLDPLVPKPAAIHDGTDVLDSASMSTDFPAVAVILAVIGTRSGGDGWESNPPRTPQQRPANGFEDRGPCLRGRLLASTHVRSWRLAVRQRPQPSMVVRQLGCHFGCQGRTDPCG